MAKELINSLQVFRGIAALAVVAHHAALSTDAFVQSLPGGWLRVFDLGAFGVDFFFVLSGFIIMHAHRGEVGNPAATRIYLGKRLARIFPAYWPIGLSMLGLYAALPGFSASGGREFSVLSSVLLLPMDLPPALSVAWTLVHELLFYTVFMLWFISRPAFWYGLALWASAILAVQFFGEATGWLGYPMSLLNLEFMLGVLAASYYGRASLRFCTAMMVAGGLLASVMLFLLYAGYAAGHRLGLALGLAAMMYGIARWEQHRAIAWPLMLMAIGNASYSIYLVHNPLLSLTQRLAGQQGMTWPLALFAGMVISVICGYLYYLWVERPALRLFRGYWLHAPRCQLS